MAKKTKKKTQADSKTLILNAFEQRKEENAQLKKQLAAFQRNNQQLRDDLRTAREKFQEELALAKTHPHRIEEQIKTWSLAFDRLGISLSIVGSKVEFSKGTIAVSLHIDHVLAHGMHLVIQMLSLVPGKPLVYNHVDGIAGWKHPDAIEADRDLALSKAARSLYFAGFKPGENVTLTVPSDE